MGFPGGTSGKEPTYQCRRQKRHRFHPWVRKIPWRRASRSIPVILAWKIPRTEEPGRLQSIGSQRVRQHWSDLVCMHAWWAAVSLLLTDMCGSLSWKDPQAIVWFPPATLNRAGVFIFPRRQLRPRELNAQNLHIEPTTLISPPAGTHMVTFSAYKSVADFKSLTI